MNSRPLVYKTSALATELLSHPYTQQDFNTLAVSSAEQVNQVVVTDVSRRRSDIQVDTHTSIDMDKMEKKLLNRRGI